MLNNDFPRILTLLRKERGLSQKKAAADLGISQALLSHYEKGIRECGLDFLIRAAAYYGVSCDYLLGRTPHPSGAVVSPGSLPSEGAASGSGGGHSAAEYQRRVLVNSLNIVFGILKKINSEGVTRHVCAYLSTALYKMFRLLYSARGKNPQEAFSLNRGLYAYQANAHMLLSEGKARYLLDGSGLGDAAGVAQDSLPALSPEKLQKEFPLFAPSLLELVQNTEQSIAGKKPG